MSRFDRARFLALCRTDLGNPLEAVAETGSTNDDAMEAARLGAPHGATFVADSQTRGRGRRGARWSSPPGENLLCSVLLRPDLTPELAGTLTLAVGLAVRDVVAARVPGSRSVRVKWPNDVLIDGAKVAGILLESQIEAGRVAAVVVGIGLNVAMRELPAELRGIATSLALAGDPSPSREEVLASLLAALEARTAVHAREGLFPALAELREHDALLGRRARADRVEGIAAGIAGDGALLIRDDDGTEHRVTSGSVTLR